MSKRAKREKQRYLASPRPGLSPLACPHCSSHTAYIERRPKHRFTVRCAMCRVSGPIADDMQEAVQNWNQIRRF